MKNLLLFGAIIFSLTSEAQISLEACIEAAEKNSSQTQLIQLVKQAEILQINALNKNLLPQASIGGQATWQSAVTSFPLKLPNIEVPTIPKDQYKATFDFNQTIWDGGQLKGQKLLTNASTNTEIKNIESNIFQLREQISNLYFGVLLASKQYELSKISQNDIQNQLNRAKANIQNGTVIKSSGLALEAKLIEINQLQREIRSRKLAALNGLTILTGLDINENSDLSQPQNLVNDNANINRPELYYFDAQEQMLNANKSITDAKYRPKLALFGTAGYGRPGLNFLSPDFGSYFIGGLSLKIPVSQIYTQSKGLDYQLIDINKLKIGKQKALFVQQVRLKLGSLNEEAAKLTDQIIEDEKLIKIRAEIKKASANKLENGVATVSEFLTDSDNESIAMENLVLHQIQLMQVQNAIKLALGNK
ncbi:MAG: TolC family protein [Bacteroidota bacterium]